MKKAFTLIELLVVISIIALLIALLLPALTTARYQARIVQCKAILRGTGTGLITYATDFDGSFPVAADAYFGDHPTHGLSFLGGTPRQSWALAQSGSGAFDLRPSYQEYLTGAPDNDYSALDKAFKCPMATEFFVNGSYNNYTSSFVLSNYMLFRSNQVSNRFFAYANEPSHGEWGMAPGIDDQMWTKWDANAGNPFRFTLLAADWVANGSDTSLNTGHPSTAGSLGETPLGNVPNHSQMAYQIGPAAPPVPINWLDVDGRVETHTVTSRTLLDTANWTRNGGYGGGQPWVLPLDMAR